MFERRPFFSRCKDSNGTTCPISPSCSHDRGFNRCSDGEICRVASRGGGSDNTSYLYRQTTSARPARTLAPQPQVRPSTSSSRGKNRGRSPLGVSPHGSGESIGRSFGVWPDRLRRGNRSRPAAGSFARRLTAGGQQSGQHGGSEQSLSIVLVSQQKRLQTTAGYGLLMSGPKTTISDMNTTVLTQSGVRLYAPIARCLPWVAPGSRRT